MTNHASNITVTFDTHKRVVDAWSLEGFNFITFIVCIPMLTDGSTSVTFL